jgi:hypothetical protein
MRHTHGDDFDDRADHHSPTLDLYRHHLGRTTQKDANEKRCVRFYVPKQTPALPTRISASQNQDDPETKGRYRPNSCLAKAYRKSPVTGFRRDSFQDVEPRTPDHVKDVRMKRRASRTAPMPITRLLTTRDLATRRQVLCDAAPRGPTSSNDLTSRDRPGRYRLLIE